MKIPKKFSCAVLALTMMLALTSCGGNNTADEGEKPKTITVGSSNFTEAIILGNLYSELIEANTEYEVEQRFNLAGAAVCFDALLNGDIDMFVEYTGTALMNLLEQPMDTDKDRVWQTVYDRMLEDYGIHTSDPLGFNNTYVMSVKPETAETYGLKTLSDLIEKSPELRLGCTVEFIQREDCLPLLESEYGVAFKETSGLDASLRYDAIEAGEVDVVDAFATDALLSKLGLTMLEDDLSFFPPYYAVNFVDQELLDADPELAEVLRKLDSAISEEDMAAMNAQVDVDGMDAVDVAHQFLVEKGLVTE